MKILYAIAFVIFIQFSALGQSVPNGDFESWEITPYSSPNDWVTSNPESLNEAAIITVTQTTDSYSGLAIKLQTFSVTDDTVGAYITNSYGDPIAGEGGVPYSQQPTHINGYYKYTLPANDTALLLVIFKKAGSIVSMDLFKIKGTGQQTTYVPFSFPLSLSVVPDTVIVAAASSNLVTEQGVEPGSTLWLDELFFTGAATMPALPNGNFELWTQLTYALPSAWDSDGTVGQAADAWSGSYAVKLETIQYGPSEFGFAGITNGEFTNSGPVGGQPYTSTSDTFSGYYKYYNTTGDSADIRLAFYKNGTIVGWFSKRLGPASSYTYFSIPISLSIVPDTVRVEIQSSNWNNFSNIGPAELYIDHIQFDSDPVSVSLLNATSLVSVYPNPVKNELRIYPGELGGDCYFFVYNIQGHEVMTRHTVQPVPGNSFLIDVSQLNSGSYFFRVCTDKECRSGRFIKLE